MDILSSRIRVSETNTYGLGVFASSFIPKGEIVYNLDGHHVCLDEMINRVLDGDEAINDPLQIGMQEYIILDFTSHSFNHNCSPNAIVCGKSDLISIRDISIGDEVTFDYSLTIAPTDWRMECKCGSPLCRGVASDVSTVPRAVLLEYFNAGLLQDYMREILPNVIDGTYRIPQFEIDALKKLSEGR